MILELDSCLLGLFIHVFGYFNHVDMGLYYRTRCTSNAVFIGIVVYYMHWSITKDIGVCVCTTEDIMIYWMGSSRIKGTGLMPDHR
ncbi:hypothetical protein TSAR_006837 [Trichomalopsis sarcophagae]|uniref:Uncharacterized protein n=1 Tax=Trichomalopsis sarcophagae TaxID=543379 RepID=A0A232FBN7_9HYME|nr:hypothetical protein TSAR_006837 [Trichomalopsis sarcophagae]